MQDCLDKKCPNEASACKKDVTGCLTPALKCDSKCGNDVACLRTCAAASGNQHLKDLAACGEKNCANLKYKKLESPMQDCLDKKCPNEASACKKDVTGCLTPALKCDSKCGNDVACLRTCAAASGNQHLKDLAACGEKNCANLSFDDMLGNVQTCLQ